MPLTARNLWELVEARKLPRETMNYIPKFLAAVIVGSNPEKYGFADVEKRAPLNVVSVTVPGSVRLKHIAKVSGIPYKQLKRHNPHLIRRMTPPRHRKYRIWVHKDKAPLFQEDPLQKQLATYRIRYKSKKKTTTAIAVKGSHKVRRGETLGSISKKYGIPVSKLRRWNKVKGNRIIAGQKLTLRNPDNRISGAVSYQRYRVRRGDNLDKISRKFGTPVRELRKMNGIRGSRIYAGQLLKVKKSRG